MPYVPYRKTYKKRSYPKKASKPMYKSKFSSYRRKPSVATVKKIVKKAIARDVENKTIQYYSDSAVPIYPLDSVNFTTNNIYSVSLNNTTLSMGQGVGNGQRVGNRVKIKSAFIAGTIYPAPYDAGSNPTPQPTQVAIWIFYDKQFPSSVPNPTSDFFQRNNTVQPMDGTLQDLYSPINTDKYRVLTKRIFKIGYAAATGTGAVPGSQNFANNDFKLNVSFKIPLTKYMIKNVKFNDASPNPTTRNLYFMILPVASNGSTFAAAGRPCNYFYNMSITYEDA